MYTLILLIYIYIYIHYYIVYVYINIAFSLKKKYPMFMSILLKICIQNVMMIG